MPHNRKCNVVECVVETKPFLPSFLPSFLRLAIPYNISFLSAYKLTLTPSSSDALQGMLFRFTCTVTAKRPSYLDDDVCFHREKRKSWCLEQHSDRCAPVTHSKAHMVTCGNGTRRAMAKKRTYLMTIPTVMLDDVVEWWCYLTKTGRRSVKFRLKLRSELIYIYIYI